MKKQRTLSKMDSQVGIVPFFSDKLITPAEAEAPLTFADWLTNIEYTKADLYQIAEYWYNEATKLKRGGKRQRLTPQQLLAIQKVKGSYEAYLDQNINKPDIVTRKTFTKYSK